jgi:hypothetical protein
MVPTPTTSEPAMSVIVTKYLPPTNNRGARIKASLSPGWGSAKPVTINYEFGLPGSTNHERAALAFAEACGLTGTFVRLDAVLNGYMFVRDGVLCKSFTIADHPYVANAA